MANTSHTIDDFQRMSPLVMGGAGFSYQLTPDPENAPIVEILKSAFDAGVRTIDTSPYYEPSEQLLGTALQDPKITNKYSRNDFLIMTKVGRITATHLDYSPTWIKQSVIRSLARFNTSYLDVVFAHDVELVPMDQALIAVQTLFELAKSGCIRYVGISGYDLDVLANIAELAPKLFGRSLDTIQTWGQMTLQNNRLETYGLSRFRQAGVKMIFSSSPLAIGLLRSEPVPVGRLGNWHPAPEDLRAKAHEAAKFVAAQGEDFASLALRHAIRKSQSHCSSSMVVSTISGVSTIRELQENVESARLALGCEDLSVRSSKGVNAPSSDADTNLCERVREMLKPWLNYDFSKQCVVQDAIEESQIAESTSIARL